MQSGLCVICVVWKSSGCARLFGWVVLVGAAMVWIGVLLQKILVGAAMVWIVVLLQRCPRLQLMQTVLLSTPTAWYNISDTDCLSGRDCLSNKTCYTPASRQQTRQQPLLCITQAEPANRLEARLGAKQNLSPVKPCGAQQPGSSSCARTAAAGWCFSAAPPSPGFSTPVGAATRTGFSSWCVRMS